MYLNLQQLEKQDQFIHIIYWKLSKPNQVYQDMFKSMVKAHLLLFEIKFPMIQVTVMNFDPSYQMVLLK